MAKRPSAPVDIKRERRRQKIAEFIVGGLTIQTRIRERLEVEHGITADRGTIRKDIKALKDRWAESALVDMNAQLGLQLAKLDGIEEAAWQGWRMSLEQWSQQNTERKENAFTDEDGNETRAPGAEIKAKVRRDDPRPDGQFLAVLLQCLRQRSLLLGLGEIDLTAQLNLNIVNIRKEAEKVTNEDLMARIKSRLGAK